ncbi:hypothetical protein ABIG06_002759 [Bradyrhizobium sp. USDA 326]|uniref:hypothetical protein n=1 Tax=unclassified Bradyrhizobium TaxID=2631580 RepID=UPI0035113903
MLDAGVDALGFDPVAAGSDRGSSHGSCRIFRRFNFENPNYTSLSDEAHAGWIRLQTDSGQTLLTETPVLDAGRPGSAMVASLRAAAIAEGRPDPMLTAAQANKEFRLSLQPTTGTSSCRTDAFKRAGAKTLPVRPPAMMPLCSCFARRSK